MTEADRLASLTDAELINEAHAAAVARERSFEARWADLKTYVATRAEVRLPEAASAYRDVLHRMLGEPLLPALDSVRAYMTATGWAALSDGKAGQLWHRAGARASIGVLWEAEPGSWEWEGIIDRLARAEDRAYADVLASIAELEASR
ncbi:MAG: hypothetical protein M3Y33_11045 [Actinomycetota bacterium]|nr:hypothetical protein [Actinomycetota bacterium]